MKEIELIQELSKLIEKNNELEIELRDYRAIMSFLMKRENKLQRIETMFKNNIIDLKELSKIVKENI